MTRFMPASDLATEVVDDAVYAARLIRPGHAADYREAGLYATLLPTPGSTSSLSLGAMSEPATPHQGLRHLVALAAARVEQTMPKYFWRAPSRDHVLHLTHLRDWGYTLADVEQLVVDAAEAGERS